jgi:predicted membrane protein
MKTTYIFGAILACSIIGAVVGARTAKTIFLLMTAILAAYGLFRILG